jgi:oligosaccharyltransferase complex subunit gamma
MRWLPAFLSASLLAGGALAAKKSSEERFNKYQAKSLTSTPVKLQEGSYKELTSSPRDYSVAVLLTALEARFGCELCREFHPEWDLLAHSWIKGDKAGDSRHLFGTLDFSDGRNIFLEVCHAPNLPSLSWKCVTNYLP